MVERDRLHFELKTSEINIQRLRWWAHELQQRAVDVAAENARLHNLRQSMLRASSLPS